MCRSWQNSIRRFKYVGEEASDFLGTKSCLKSELSSTKDSHPCAPTALPRQSVPVLLFYPSCWQGLRHPDPSLCPWSSAEQCRHERVDGAMVVIANTLLCMGPILLWCRLRDSLLYITSVNHAVKGCIGPSIYQVAISPSVSER